MKTELFVHRSRIPASAPEVFAWHALPDALVRLSPPAEHVEIVKQTGGITPGSRVVLRFGQWPFLMWWIAEHTEYEEGRYFTDVQVSGPFAYWKHTHTFEPDGSHGCYLEDRLEYALPFGFVGRLFAGRFVRRKLQQLFEYRHRITVEEMAVFRGSRQ